MQGRRFIGGSIAVVGSRVNAFVLATKLAATHTAVNPLARECSPTLQSEARLVPVTGRVIRCSRAAGDLAVESRYIVSLEQRNDALNWLGSTHALSFRGWRNQSTTDSHIHGLFQSTIVWLLTDNSWEQPAGQHFKLLRNMAPLRLGHDMRDIIPDFDTRCRALTRICYRGNWPGFRTATSALLVRDDLRKSG